MTYRILEGDVFDRIAEIGDGSVQTVITSPPYWGLRDYGTNGQLGLEATPEEYVERMVEVFREVRRVLRNDGTCWLNLGDSYANDTKWGGSTGGKHVNGLHGATGVGRQKTATGLKPKDLVGIPWRVAFALQADGWYLRSDIIWAKPNPMPEAVTDRPTKAHEYIFLLSKSARYYFDADAVREGYNLSTLGRYAYEFGHGPAAAVAKSPAVGDGNGHMAEPNPAGRNIRTVWNVATEPFPGAHFATFPKKLIEPCVKAGSASGDTVLDPFCGSGTTGVVALRHGRSFVGIELNPEYAQMARDRIHNDGPLFNVEAVV